MKWRKWAAAMAGVAAAGLVLAGCGRGAEKPAEAPAADTGANPVRSESAAPRARTPRARTSGDLRTVELPGGVPLELVWVEGGAFKMGSEDFDAAASGNETPQHEVVLTRGFWMGRYEVTQAQWKSVMGHNPARHKGKDLPVERVSQGDIAEFLRRSNAAAQGWTMRLPTEAEWEYAARGGRLAKGEGAYSGGAEADAVGWFGENSGGMSHEVGLKEGNELGLHDMTGNVWEWCSDGYGKYSAARAVDPKGPKPGQYCVDRGGGWDSRAGRCRVAGRGWVAPNSRMNNLGFRVVVEDSAAP